MMQLLCKGKCPYSCHPESCAEFISVLFQGLKRLLLCHPEFISGSNPNFRERFWNKFRMTKSSEKWLNFWAEIRHYCMDNLLPCHPELVSGSMTKLFSGRTKQKSICNICIFFILQIAILLHFAICRVS